MTRRMQKTERNEEFKMTEKRSKKEKEEKE